MLIMRFKMECCQCVVKTPCRTPKNLCFQGFRGLLLSSQISFSLQRAKIFSLSLFLFFFISSPFSPSFSSKKSEKRSEKNNVFFFSSFPFSKKERKEKKIELKTKKEGKVLKLSRFLLFPFFFLKGKGERKEKEFERETRSKWERKRTLFERTRSDVFTIFFLLLRARARKKIFAPKRKLRLPQNNCYYSHSIKFSRY